LGGGSRVVIVDGKGRRWKRGMDPLLRGTKVYIFQLASDFQRIPIPRHHLLA